MNPSFNTKTLDELRAKLASKEYQSVLDICNELQKEDSNASVEFYLFKGIALRELKELQESYDIYKQGLKLFPENKHLLNDFAGLLILKKSYKEARSTLKKILNKNPTNATAIKNLEALDLFLMKNNKGETEKNNPEEKSRSLDPLESAFNPSEIKASSENLQKVKKLKLEKKLKQLPSFPIIDQEIIAEEFLMAARDSLRSKHPEIALKFCEYSVLNKGNIAQTYGIAGDAYIELKEYNNAHLCYLIASENGELESAQQLNLLSLTAVIGDKNLLEKRNSVFNDKLIEQPKLYKGAQKILTTIGDMSTIKFHKQFGPINARDLEKKTKRG